MQDVIVTNYEQTVPLWNEAENVQTTKKIRHKITTHTKVPKIGVMLVGLGGNNGSTFTAGILANKKQQTWESKNGIQTPNFNGSFTQSATAHVGYKYNDKTCELEDVYKPIKDLLPMANPCDFEISGWDINGANMYEACKRAHVLEPTLIEALRGDLEAIKPLSSVLNQDYIAANQADRVDNIFEGTNQEKIDKIRKDIRDMKERVDKVIVLWTANTEIYMLPEIEDIDSLKSKVSRNASMAGWKVFWGDPFRYNTCSSIAAMQKRTEAAMEVSLLTLDFKDSMSSISGSIYISVFAVQRTMTLSTLSFISLISYLILSIFSWLVPSKILSTRSA
jgi:hypothetical protein